MWICIFHPLQFFSYGFFYRFLDNFIYFPSVIVARKCLNKFDSRLCHNLLMLHSIGIAFHLLPPNNMHSIAEQAIIYNQFDVQSVLHRFFREPFPFCRLDLLEHLLL